ncbi:hypothetical protein [Parvibaculum sp.]|uniref:hypothetical protein n=1 Tax=Parvibaculum sp. TaxID=2024848 RepID=UPI0027307070|nr:hypothetical protein [Parvibaculum sp.]MDP1628877.1 hypothetical protein [Parvibaculum sp.]MDP2148272.1 hypothetical protein [Parvibaculum sp.]MDP3327731.1 hypothetical protein [Parvibaculum sp.]
MSNAYVAWVTTPALKAATNEIINLIWNQPIGTNSFGRDLNTSGSHLDPVELVAAHPSLSSEEAVVFDNLLDNMPVPEGGWPLMDGETVVLTEADALVAAEAFHFYRTNDPNANNLAYAAAANGMQVIEYPE